MSYDHYANLSATLRPNTTVSQICKALEPVLSYLDWAADEALKNTTGDGVSLEVVEADGKTSMYFYASGNVGDSYRDRLQEAAENLLDLVEPAAFECVNTDCPNPEDATDTIWIGHGHELEMAQRKHVIEKIYGHLSFTIKDPVVLKGVIDQIVSAPLPGQTPAQTQTPPVRPRQGA